MIKAIKVFLIIIGISILSLPAYEVMAYDPPGPPNGHGDTGNQEPTGGSAPIAGGLPFLILMGVAYGTRKYLNSVKEK